MIGSSARTAEPPLSAGAQLLAQIVADLQSLETFRAEFEQRQEWVGMDPTPAYRGTLSLLRPNRFRLEYREPAGHLQVSDGKKVWTFIPENGEVLAADLEGAPGGGGDLLRWVLTHGKARPEVARETLAGRPARALTLDPDPGLGLSLVRIWTEAEAPGIRQYEITDESGNRTTYLLTRTERNPRLAEELFHFTPPEGIPVVELGAP